jgi:hypothetical protein
MTHQSKCTATQLQVSIKTPPTTPTRIHRPPGLHLTPAKLDAPYPFQTEDFVDIPATPEAVQQYHHFLQSYVQARLLRCACRQCGKFRHCRNAVYVYDLYHTKPVYCESCTSSCDTCSCTSDVADIYKKLYTDATPDSETEYEMADTNWREQLQEDDGHEEVKSDRSRPPATSSSSMSTRARGGSSSMRSARTDDVCQSVVLKFRQTMDSIDANTDIGKLTLRRTTKTSPYVIEQQKATTSTSIQPCSTITPSPRIISFNGNTHWVLQRDWYLDFGPRHITNDIRALGTTAITANITLSKREQIQVDTMTYAQLLCKSINEPHRDHVLRLEDIVYVPNVPRNLVSLPQLTKEGYTIIFVGPKAGLWHASTKSLIDIIWHCGGYRVQGLTRLDQYVPTDTTETSTSRTLSPRPQRRHVQQHTQERALIVTADMWLQRHTSTRTELAEMGHDTTATTGNVISNQGECDYYSSIDHTSRNQQQRERQVALYLDSERHPGHRVMWTSDSGCTSHFTSVQADFMQMDPCDIDVHVADNYSAKAEGIGLCVLDTTTVDDTPVTLILENVYFVPAFSGQRLLSINKLTNEGATVTYAAANALLTLADGLTKIQLYKHQNLWVLLSRAVAPHRAYSVTEASRYRRAHWRLGHPSEQYQNRLVTEKLATGLDYKARTKPEACGCCSIGKSIRKHVPRERELRDREIMDLCHIDICFGPNDIASIKGCTLCLLIVEDVTRFSRVYLIKKKDDSVLGLKSFIEEFGTPRALQVDSDTVLLGGAFSELCKSRNIVMRASAPYFHQQSGVAERRWGMIKSKARMLMAAAGLPLIYWGHAVQTACYLINRIYPAAEGNEQTAFQAMYQREPFLAHLRIFGAKAYVHIDKKQRGKWDHPARVGVMVGYSETSKDTYQIYFPETNSYQLSRSCVFDEEEIMLQYEQHERNRLGRNRKNQPTESTDLEQTSDNDGWGTDNDPLPPIDHQIRESATSSSDTSHIRGDQGDNRAISASPDITLPEGATKCSKSRSRSASPTLRQDSSRPGSPSTQRTKRSASQTSPAKMVSEIPSEDRVSGDGFTLPSAPAHKRQRSATKSDPIVISDSDISFEAPSSTTQSPQAALDAFAFVDDDYDTNADTEPYTQSPAASSASSSQTATRTPSPTTVSVAQTQVPTPKRDHNYKAMVNMWVFIPKSRWELGPIYGRIVKYQKESRGAFARFSILFDGDRTPIPWSAQGLCDDPAIEVMHQRPGAAYREQALLVTSALSLHAEQHGTMQYPEHGWANVINNEHITEYAFTVIDNTDRGYEPRTYLQAIRCKFAKEWQASMSKEMGAHERLSTYKLVPMDQVGGQQVIPTRWLFKVKRESTGEIAKLKSRWIVQGHHQKHDSALGTEDIYAPTVKSSTMKTFLAIIVIEDLDCLHLDITNAFVSAPLKKPAYVKLPPGYEQKDKRGVPMVAKCLKAIYGLREAPRCFAQCLADYLVKIGLKQSVNDPCLFISLHEVNINHPSPDTMDENSPSDEDYVNQVYEAAGYDSDSSTTTSYQSSTANIDDGLHAWEEAQRLHPRRLIVLVFVDDILCGGTPPACAWLLAKLKERFECNSLGELSWYLGMKVQRDRKRKTLTLTMTKYIDDCLQRFNMTNCNAVSTPMIANSVLTATDTTDTPFEDPNEYRSCVGALLFLCTQIRPDCSNAISHCARYMQSPMTSHWQACKRILRYLAGTKDVGIRFNGNSDQEFHGRMSFNFKGADVTERKKLFKAGQLVGYSDADWARDLDTRRSQSGYIYLLAGAPVAWRSARQPTVALSSCESEYVALAEASCEAIFLRRVLAELHHRQPTPTTIYEDNTGAIGLTNAPIHHKRMKHVDIKYNFVRERALAKQIEVQQEDTKYMLADALTKPITGPQLQRFRQAVMNR